MLGRDHFDSGNGFACDALVTDPLSRVLRCEKVIGNLAHASALSAEEGEPYISLSHEETGDKCAQGCPVC